jgi:hypothetical protein
MILLHFIVVRRFEHASDPENYTSGSVANGRAFLAGQVKGQASEEERHPKLMLEAASYLRTHSFLIRSSPTNATNS